MSDRIETWFHENSEQLGSNLPTGDEEGSLLFSVDVREVVNNTNLSLPDQGNIIFESMSSIENLGIFLFQENNSLILSYFIGAEVSEGFKCLGRLKHIEWEL